MHYNADPDFVMHYCIQETALSPLVRRMTFSTEHGEGVMCLLELWTGVQVWTIDFHVPQLPIRPTGDYHYLKLNFCTGGRCEVPLPAGYIYIDQGTLSVDVNPPVGVMLCPGGCYGKPIHHTLKKEIFISMSINAAFTSWSFLRHIMQIRRCQWMVMTLRGQTKHSVSLR